MLCGDVRQACTHIKHGFVMAAESIHQLIQIAAEKSRKLKPGERRRLVVYWDEHSPRGEAPSLQELAERLGVSEAVVQTDRRRIEQQFIDQISPERAMHYVGRVLFLHQKLIREAMVGLDTSLPGSLSHQAYLKIASDLSARELKTLQSVGIVREELGHMTVTEEKWVAVIDEFGVATSSADDGNKVSAPPPVDAGDEVGDVIREM